MKRSRAWVVLAALVAGLLFFSLSKRDGPAALEEEERGIPEAGQALRADGLIVLEGTDFDRNYLAAGDEMARDLERVDAILQDAMLLVKEFDQVPLADNADFTAFLQGRNSHRVAWIRPGHPAVNERGELTDRWGGALFFHRESARRTTLRSAGPDRRMGTDDDIE